MQDTWIEWNGGKCPTANEEIVRFITRSGRVDSLLAGQIEWTHNGGKGDIIAYQPYTFQCDEVEA